jgi:hypothetical protein
MAAVFFGTGFSHDCLFLWCVIYSLRTSAIHDAIAVQRRSFYA